MWSQNASATAEFCVGLAVGVIVGVAVAAGVSVEVAVAVAVAVGVVVDVAVGVAVAVSVAIGVAVGSGLKDWLGPHAVRNRTRKSITMKVVCLGIEVSFVQTRLTDKHPINTSPSPIVCLPHKLALRKQMRR
jgi:hypothetical protein